MGKKVNHISKKKADKQAPKAATVNNVKIHLHKMLHKCTFKRKAPTAVKKIREFVRKLMFTKDVRIDTELNQTLWRNGIRNVDRRVTVTLEKRQIEDDEEAQEKFYTLVRLSK